MPFDLQSNYQPAGDQPEAIRQLTSGIKKGEPNQVLLGVTGSGKTFTMANVIAQVDKPTLIITHNKTLTAQLYGEFKQFFPNNSVEYFVSYYDYYQPEAYIAVTDTYIEKDLAINQEIDKLRMRAVSQLLSGRRDVIIVASVSCIYGMGNPEDYKSGIIRLSVGDQLVRNDFLYKLVDSLYSRTDIELDRGSFKVLGDVVEINPPYADFGYKITFFGDEIETLEVFDFESRRTVEKTQHLAIFPANLYMTPKDKFDVILGEIEAELREQCRYFDREAQDIESRRIHERTMLDLEMMREVGYCSGIENYSRFFDGRKPGTRPFCLLDYFPDDYMMIIDESHVTMPQFRGMYGGDRARKLSLVSYGFRLPSAIDNRPLNFTEFEELMGQAIFVSATPSDYELQQSGGVVVEQIVRPTGLLDPPIEVRPVLNQVDNLLEEIRLRRDLNERVLVTTLTKRMAEELAKYFTSLDINCRYIHSDVETFERVEILRDLRLGHFDVLIGVNLLREGLDLPEVSLVAIMDADKEGFLRNDKSLTQTAGRAARNANGLVIMYAERITNSMARTIDETNRRRSLQIEHNAKHGITPTTVFKSHDEILKQSSVLDFSPANKNKNKSMPYMENSGEMSLASDPIMQYMSKEQLEKLLKETEKRMKAAAKDLDFITAAQLRDEMISTKNLIQTKFP
jgi:excinuclease ABC subunit B